MQRLGLFAPERINLHPNEICNRSYFDLLDKSKKELIKLAKNGELGPYGSGELKSVKAVLAGERPICFIEACAIDNKQALEFAKSSPELEIIRWDFGDNNYWHFVFRKENKTDALQRIKDYKFLFNQPGGAYVHGVILGYKPEDIALFLLRHPEDGEAFYEDALQAKEMFAQNPPHLLRSGTRYMSK